ncbi:MAG: transporter substrate-binding domain-containing protein [Pseudomonadota bacterium]
MNIISVANPCNSQIPAKGTKVIHHAPQRWLSILLLAAVLLPKAADAACSRVIVLPAAESGKTIAFKNGEAVGVVPDVFKSIAANTGCVFKWSPVPKTRMEAMFAVGQADLLLAATQTEQRDSLGVFVPLVESRATLLSLGGERPPVHNFAELLARRELRVALVRGYDYGEQYRELAKALTAQGRIYLERDAVSIGRLMAAGAADVTIMPPATFAGALRDDARVVSLLARLRIEPLDELPWIKTGIYLSKKSLSPTDRDLLESALIDTRNAGAWWAALNKHHSQAELANHVRPLVTSK